MMETNFLQALASVTVEPSAIGLLVASDPSNDPSLHKPWKEINIHMYKFCKKLQKQQSKQSSLAVRFNEETEPFSISESSLHMSPNKTNCVNETTAQLSKVTQSQSQGGQTQHHLKELERKDMCMKYPKLLWTDIVTNTA